jgi:hypothetical protein
VQAFREDPANQGKFREAPIDGDLVELMPDGCLDRRRRGPCNSRVGVATVPVEPGINVSEFARFICVLTQVQHVRAELLTSGMDLTRAQLDRHEGRDDMWSKSIETAFNDPTTVLSLPAMADMPEVDARTVPQWRRQTQIYILQDCCAK